MKVNSHILRFFITIFGEMKPRFFYFNFQVHHITKAFCKMYLKTNLTLINLIFQILSIPSPKMTLFTYFYTTCLAVNLFQIITLIKIIIIIILNIMTILFSDPAKHNDRDKNRVQTEEFTRGEKKEKKMANKKTFYKIKGSSLE